MSKSRGNVVNPDEYIRAYGADATRMALLFLGPFDEDADFSDRGVVGKVRFLGRVWDLCADDRPPTTDDRSVADTAGGQWSVVGGRFVRRVTDELEARRFHTAIAALMEYANWLRGAAGQLPGADFAEARCTLVSLLAPFAPHLAEELWLRLGGVGSVHDQPWPTANVGAQATIDLPVQVDGRLHDRIVVAADALGDDVRAMALETPKVRKAIGERAVRRVVVVPGRVVNVVTEAAASSQ